MVREHNPEAAMVHANLLPTLQLNSQQGNEHPPSAAFFDLPWPWPTSKPEAKPEAGTVPGFDSEAHRAFLRSLG